MKLLEEVVRSFKSTKLFNHNVMQVWSMDFSDDGEYLLTCSQDDQIIVYDCQGGNLWKIIMSKKYGSNLGIFTHERGIALHGSTSINDNIRYLSLYNNRYIRYFEGHTKRVTSMVMNPLDDTFASTALDRTVRIWDIRCADCSTVTETGANPIAAYHPEGRMLAVASDSSSIKIHDLRYFSKSGLLQIYLPPDKECDWTGLKFSPDGGLILISTNNSSVKVLESLIPEPIFNFRSYANRGLPIEASFTPDSQFVLVGSSDGLVHVWSVRTGRKVCSLVSPHPSPVQCVQFNPKLMMMVSTCHKTAFWLPNIYEDYVF